MSVIIKTIKMKDALMKEKEVIAWQLDAWGVQQ